MVVSDEDVRSLLSMEAQRAVLRCDEESSYLSEISGALDARFVVSTQLTKLGRRYQLTVSVFDADRARVTARKAVEGEVFRRRGAEDPFIAS